MPWMDRVGTGFPQASMGPRPIGRGNSMQFCVIYLGTVASMGPRPIGRGNRPGEGALMRYVELQWGRDRSVAEIWAELTDERGNLLASMGPRPIGRGNASLGRRN